MKFLLRILSVLVAIAIFGFTNPSSSFALDGGEETIGKGDSKFPNGNADAPEGTTTVSFVIYNDGNLNPSDIVIGLKPPYNEYVGDGTVVIDKVPTGNSGNVQVTINNVAALPDNGKFVAEHVYLAHDIGVTADDLSGKEEKPTHVFNTVSDLVFFTGGTKPDQLANMPRLEYEELEEVEGRENNVNTFVEGFEAYQLQESSVKVFPNPSNGTFSVNIQADVKIEQITVLNMVGQVVYTEAIPQLQNQINLSEMPEGVYFVQILSGETKIVKRVVIDK